MRAGTSLAWRKLRLAVHLLRGVMVVLWRMPGASPERRRVLVETWARTLLRLAGVCLVPYHDARARCAPGAPW